jgi:hypothetical protein
MSTVEKSRGLKFLPKYPGVNAFWAKSQGGTIPGILGLITIIVFL